MHEAMAGKTHERIGKRSDLRKRGRLSVGWDTGID
jgi:hypothetical protein